MTASPRLALVVPCYNEAARLDRAAFLDFVASRTDTALLFVNDGSTDDTPAVLADLACRGNGRIEALALPANRGKAEAVRQGVLAALQRGPQFVGFWDADLSTPLEASAQFLDVLTSTPAVDVVTGARVKLLGRKVRRNQWRHYAGRVFATAASAVLHVPVYDTQCGAKIFRVGSPAVDGFEQPFRSKWVFDVELLARYIDAVGAHRAQAGIHELPLLEWNDVPGSKLRPRHAVRAAWDLWRIAMSPARAGRSRRPPPLQPPPR
jgi:glycosyltransferase involved in cell wall biosynthesis